MENMENTDHPSEDSDTWDPDDPAFILLNRIQKQLERLIQVRTPDLDQLLQMLAQEGPDPMLHQAISRAYLDRGDRYRGILHRIWSRWLDATEEALGPTVRRFMGFSDQALDYFFHGVEPPDVGQLPCNYFSDLRMDRIVRVPLRDIQGPQALESLLEQGFRHTGEDYSSNFCSLCRRCIQIRYPVAEFRPSTSQKRVLRKFQKDLRLEVGHPGDPEPQRFPLYRDYLVRRHNFNPDFLSEEEESRHRWQDTVELRVYREATLFSVIQADLAQESYYAYSSFYHPEAQPYSPGILNLLLLLDWGRHQGRRYLYLGEYIEEKSNMVYKKYFRPHEIRVEDSWVKA